MSGKGSPGASEQREATYSFETHDEGQHERDLDRVGWHQSDELVEMEAILLSPLLPQRHVETGSLETMSPIESKPWRAHAMREPLKRRQK